MTHDPADDIALVKDGVVVQVHRAPTDASTFGEAPDGDLIDFAPGMAVCGMTWDGTTLAAPTPPSPPAERRLIPKSTVIERVNDAGKAEAVFAALQASPIAFARWFSPNWPNVYADDPDMLALLTGAGCTADQIAVITAP